MTGANARTASRRNVLKAGALLVSFATTAPAQGASPLPLDVSGPRPDQLDSFIALKPDGGFLVFFGKIDPGQGLDVAIAQIVAEELDVSPAAIEVIQGDTSRTTDQGGASASVGIQSGAIPLRYAAAEARRLLVERAARALDAAPDTLATAAGAVFVRADPSRRIGYAALRGQGRFDTALTWNGELGNSLKARGLAEPKPPGAYTLVGASVPRDDIRQNTFGALAFVTDIRLDGMLHARAIRPPAAGAIPVSVDAKSVRHIPGAQVVHVRGLVAVLAPKEWNAIRAAEALKIQWSHPGALPATSDTVFDYLRTSPPTAAENKGVAAARSAAVLQGAPRRISASYEWPFQSHASLGPACAVANVTRTRATVWTGSQKPHGVQRGVAKLLGLPPSRVRAIWVRGPGSYGRNDAGDAALEAAYLSRAVGKPVRLQYTRAQGTAWDPKGPASVHLCDAALDESGAVKAFSFRSRGFSRFDVFHSESDPRDTLVGQLIGLGQNHSARFTTPEESYVFPEASLSWETVAPLLQNASPLRTAHLRDPLGHLNFASESFLDELAHASGQDPVAFRLRHLKDPRAIAVIQAAAERAGWGKPAPSPGALARGRGFAFGLRMSTYVAVVVDVDVDLSTGAVRPVLWTVAHDCGLVVNPRNLDLTIEGNIVMATSRALLEEVTFDSKSVTSVDWLSYPILDITQAPDAIDIVQINRPEAPPTGAGEAATRPVAAAIGNAIFNATGVRLRRAPFTPDRVKTAMAQAWNTVAG